MKKICIAIGVLVAAAGCAPFHPMTKNGATVPKNAIEATFLVSPNKVKEACNRRLPQLGIECSIDGAKPTPFDLGKSGILVGNDEIGILDSYPQFHLFGVLHLKLHKTEAGFSYFIGTATVYKTKLLGGALTETESYNLSFWKAVEQVLPDALTGTEVESRFLRESNARITQENAEKERKEEAAARAASQAAARAAYMNSNAYKVDAAADAIKACQQTITNARKAIAQDERVARISGYENKLLREQAGVAIVNCEDAMQQQWTKYKRHGGKAASIGDLAN